MTTNAQTTAPQTTEAVKLTVRKSSIIAPLLLLLVSMFLFAVYATESDYSHLKELLQATKAEPGAATKTPGAIAATEKKPTAKEIINLSRQFFQAKDPTHRNNLWKSFNNNPKRLFTEVGRPLLKAYLEQLADDFRTIVESLFGTLWRLGLLALIPGLAGLIYRRNFTVWFAGSFALLMALNASGLFPRLGGGAEQMPGSGRLLLFLLSQLIVLILAYRLRRQTTSVSKIPPNVWNWGLTGILVAAGIALYSWWTPATLTDAEVAAAKAKAAAAKEAQLATDERTAGKATAGLRDCDGCPGLVLLDKPYPPVAIDAPLPEALPVLKGEFRSKEGQEFARNIARKNAATRRSQMKLVKLPLYMTMFEVTHEEWDLCTKEDKVACPEIKRPGKATDRLPVAVTYAQAKAYAAWLSKKTPGAVYRLASPIEWEYAARANASFDWGWAHGNDEAKLQDYAWYGAAEGPHHVGLKQPNGFRLYDMLGNLPEWVNACGGPDGSVRQGCTEYDSTFGGKYSEASSFLRLGTSSRADKAAIRLVREAGAAAPALAPVPVAAKAPDPVADAEQAVDKPESGGIIAFLTTGITGWVFKWEMILLGLPLIYTLLRNSAAWTHSKPKNIVICLDGTSNTPDQVDQGFAATTNVYKLFRMLKADGKGMFEPGETFDASLCKRYADKQIAFYYAGVGNKYDSDQIAQVFGMASGLGAAETVERAYLDLVRVYNENDRVFIFGFSRGAAISRLLARTIDARGAPASVWTIKLFGKHRTLWSSKKRTKVPIDVLGCWDTVGAFGVAKTIAGINFQQMNAMKDLSVPESVQQAYHMVALDEQRDSFEPTLMDPDPNRPERIVEVWFAGDHANIGGGWATDRLSDITLDFLLRRISSGYAETEDLAGKDESWGLYLRAWKADKVDYWERQSDNPNVVDPDPLGQIQQWFSHLYQYRPRKLPQHAVISDTVFTRMVDSMPLYAPQALFNLNDELHRRHDLIEGQVAKLTSSELLADDDLQKIEGYKKKLRLNRFEHYWNDTLMPLRKGKFDPPQTALANPGAATTTATPPAPAQTAPAA